MVIKWVDALLVEWGGYMRESNNLGYPTSTVEYRMRNGRFGGQAVMAHDGYMPPNIQKTEAAILTLPYDLKAAVNVVYTSTGSTKEQCARHLSRQLGRRVSRDGLNKMLDQSHARLAGVFDGMRLEKRW